MLDEHRTPRRFWVEAVNTACYVSNRIYLRVHKKKTCYELMHSRTPKVGHFHVFGCKCFILKKTRSWISLRLGPSMVFSLVMHLLMVYFGTPSMFITLWFGFDYGTNPPLGTLII
jgi:hypothetical protein